jgi:methylenetetrahydrofolate reductase (NADPH)
MNILKKIEASEKPLFSFELLPPLRGHNLQSIYEAIENLLEFNPAYINITHHRDEIVYKDRPDGLIERKIIKKRPGTIAISAAVKYKYDVDVVPHLICSGFTKEETEYALIEMGFLGIEDVFALRGDTLAGQRRFLPEAHGHSYAYELVEQIENMNKGLYLDSDLQNSDQTIFCIGVAGYPEKHIEAPNIETDIDNLKKKVDAGADYIVTQLFYDNDKFYQFRDLCQKKGIDIPIFPGIKPILNHRDIELLPQTFNIDIPHKLFDEVKASKDKSEIELIGTEHAIKQSQDLIKNGIPGIHYYTLGKSDNIRKIAQECY